MIFSGAGSLSIYRRAVCSRLNVGGAGSRLGKLDLRKAPKSLTSRRLGARQLAISWAVGQSPGGKFPLSGKRRRQRRAPGRHSASPSDGSSTYCSVG